MRHFLERNGAAIILAMSGLILLSAILDLAAAARNYPSQISPGQLLTALCAIVIGITAFVLIRKRGTPMAELVLSIPNGASGQRAIDHLIARGSLDFGCSYLGSLIARLGDLPSARYLKEHAYGFHLISVPEGNEVVVANRILAWHDGKSETRGHVEEAEPNARFTLSANLGTPFTPGGDHAAYLRRMRHDKVPAGVTGKNIRVAVIDSGLDSSSGIVPADAYDVEATPPGPSTSSTDSDGHGTAMATLIRAVAPDADISVVRAMDPGGALRLWNLLAAIPIAAYDCQAHIINLSLGFSSFPLKCSGCGATIQARLLAFDKMIEGIAKVRPAGGEPPIYVAATGNETSTTAFNFPAFQAETLAVGAVTASGARSTFTNYGTANHRWHLMAPGGEETPAAGVTEHVGTGSTGEKCRGTSAATAYVSGMLALLRSEARHRSSARDVFLADVMRNHCELAAGASMLEHGSGQIVYVQAGAANSAPADPNVAQAMSHTGGLRW